MGKEVLADRKKVPFLLVIEDIVNPQGNTINYHRPSTVLDGPVNPQGLFNSNELVLPLGIFSFFFMTVYSGPHFFVKGFSGGKKIPGKGP